MGSIINFTVDVEDWYQVENLKVAISRDSWDEMEERVRDNVLRLLDLMDSQKFKGTFFVLGYIAEKDPDLIKEISSRGHEIACHGFAHELIYKQSVKDFRYDVTKAKALLEDITGNKVIGYRAPTFSITGWALDVLKEEGYVYDSSLFPFKYHDRYGKVDEQPQPRSRGLCMFRNGLFEVPMPMLKLVGRSLPWGGGGYFRLMPYKLFRAGIRKILKDNDSFTFYIHPWEIDSNQPRIKGLSFSSRFKQNVNLGSTLKKLWALGGDFDLRPVRDIIPVLPDR